MSLWKKVNKDLIINPKETNKMKKERIKQLTKKRIRRTPKVPIFNKREARRTLPIVEDST